MRNDFSIIQPWIAPNTSVLDLGCGDGSLLALLQKQKQVSGYGLEIDQDNITQCLAKGVNVVEQDLNLGLNNFIDKHFDTVIMTQALQAVKSPDALLDDMLRVGQECVITFPNFAHWRCRLYLMFNGKMPVSEALPYYWYNTPNIHLCTFADFEQLCEEKNIKILNRTVVDDEYKNSWFLHLWPNLLAEVAIYRITR